MIPFPSDFSHIFVWNKDVLLFMGVALIVWGIAFPIVRYWQWRQWKKSYTA